MYETHLKNINLSPKDEEFDKLALDGDGHLHLLSSCPDMFFENYLNEQNNFTSKVLYFLENKVDRKFVIGFDFRERNQVN